MANLYERVEELHRRVTELQEHPERLGSSEKHIDRRVEALELAVTALEIRHECLAANVTAAMPAPIPVVEPLSGTQIVPGTVLAPPPDYRSELPPEEVCGCEESVELRAEVASLRQRLESAESRIGQYEKLCQSKDGLIAARESEVAALRAEVERLRAARETSDGAMVLQLQLADARAERDAANALLGRIVKYAREDRARTPGTTRLARALSEAEAHLSGQPAAPCEPDEGCECPGAHECGVTTSTATNERKAELARREGK